MNKESHKIMLKSLFIPFTTVKAAVFIFLTGFIVFSNSLFNDFIFDDFGLIITNPSIRNLSSIPGLLLNHTGALEMSSFYRPLPYIFYTLIYSIFRENTFFYHISQLMFHSANAVLVFLIFKRYLKKDIAFFLSLIFLVHPINEQTVVYIANLQDTLFVFFGLIVIYLLQNKAETNKNIFFIYLFLLLSLLSKESGIVFFIAVLLFIALLRNTKILVYSVYSIVTLSLYFILRFIARIPTPCVSVIPIGELSFIDRMKSVPAVIFYYIKTFIYPKDLVAINTWLVDKISFNHFFFPLLADIIFFIGLFFICWLLYKKTGKSVLFFLSWFLIGLFIHIQLIPLDATVADRYFYFPIIGLLALIGLFIQTYIPTTKLVAIVGIVILTVFSIRTIARNENWKTQATLLYHDEEISHDDYQQELLYGNVLIEQGKFDQATPHIQKALSLYPNSWLAWNSLGIIFHTKNDYENARRAYLKSISINPYYGAYENMGQLLLDTNDQSPDSLSFIKKATELFPNDSNIWYKKIIIEYKAGNHDDALLAAKQYHLLKKDIQSYTIYNQLFRRLPIKIE